VGLDPDVERLPQELRATGDVVDQVLAFCLGVVDAVAGVVGVVKPQAACFERFGSRGFAALEAVCARARERGLCVILDAKRGDIGVSARHYAASASGLGAHWITVNPYLGMETLEPYLDAGLGIFALVRTSNPGSDDLQMARVVSGDSVSGLVARHVARLGADRGGALGLSDVGAVVGATKSNGGEGKSLREIMGDQILLVPGYGAQGGGVDDLRDLMRTKRDAGGVGIVVNASRSVLYPATATGDWQSAVHDAAALLVGDLGALGG
jgi:orotidine-5'-phosphate decarboxylase